MAFSLLTYDSEYTVRSALVLILVLIFSETGLARHQETYVRPSGIRSERVSFGASLGWDDQKGPYRGTINNLATFGLFFNIPASKVVGFELEANAGENRIQLYGQKYRSRQYSAGANLKFGFNVWRFRPNIGVGWLLVYHDNLYKLGEVKDAWVGSLQAFGGLEFELSPQIVLGLRTTVIAPMINRDYGYEIEGPSFRATFPASAINDIRVRHSLRIWFGL